AAHRRALAAEMGRLEQGRRGGEKASLAAAAGSQVQSILRAAEKAAADFEREAGERASSVRGDADSDARRTREEAIEAASAHLAAVSQASAALLQRVAAIDAEAGALLDSLRGGAGRLAGDVAALDASMGELYDAAAGATGAAAPPAPVPADETARRPERADEQRSVEQPASAE